MGSECETGTRRGRCRWLEGNPYTVQTLFRAVEVGGGKRKREKVRPGSLEESPEAETKEYTKQKKTRQREAVGSLCML